MNPEEIKLADWERIIAGNVPPIFYLELIIRVFAVYLLLMVSMRFLGKRMSTHISRLELATMTALASAIGVPMLSPQNGLLPAFIIAAVAVGINRVVSYISFRNERVERVTQGSVATIVEEGSMKYDVMKRVRITRERLFAQMRSLNINHLGLVKRLYIEPNGSFALVKADEPIPGLMVLPVWDEEFVSRKLRKTDRIICNNCGAPAAEGVKPGSDEQCDNCKKKHWVQAVESVS